MFCLRSLLVLCLHVASRPHVALGHGHMFWPRARNQPDSNRNGAVGGGPGTVHAFTNGVHTKYQHGICGNAPGQPQSYNKVGDIQATLTAGTMVEVKVLITAHHVGYFELELCTHAGQLSEACFMQHRLLRHDCACTCPSGTTNSCKACEKCRRWWKPVLEGETNQVVTRSYPGPVLPGEGNLVAYEFTMQYDIPAGIKTRNGVLRWHYMTTNSCTSKTSSPEEFWNCADVAVADADGDTGGLVDFDNGALENLDVENLMPQITSQPPTLTGVHFACPEVSAGELMGTGTADEYEGICGNTFANGTHERCVNTTSSQGMSSDVCKQPIPDSQILCREQCSGWFFQCANMIAYMKPVPRGTKCKDNEFVLEAVCDGFTPTTTAGAATSTTTAAGDSVAVTTTTTTAVLDGAGIQSGDSVFLMSRSGNGNHIDVEGTGVQARWKSRGNWQAMVIEKLNSGPINSGDTVYLKTHTGAHIDVEGETVQARWTDKGNWQAMQIEKRAGSGALLPGDVVCLKARHTGKHLDIEDQVVRARWQDCGDWQAMRIEVEAKEAVFSGASVHLVAHTGKRIDVENQAVQARWSEAGLWQTFVLENEGGRAIFSGDAVFLKAHTGMLLDVEGVAVAARWSERANWQRFIIEKRHGSGAILPGDAVLFRAHTGNMIDVQSTAVGANWHDDGDWQTFILEESTLRRLTESGEDAVALGSGFVVV